MRFPLPFTFLGFQFISLVDMGPSITVKDLKDNLQHGNLWTWLKVLYGQHLDISIFSETQLRGLQELFYQQSDIDEARKFGVEKNGLLLLTAYCFNLIQKDEQTVRDMAPNVFR